MSPIFYLLLLKAMSAEKLQIAHLLPTLLTVIVSGCLPQKRAESVVNPKLPASSTSINPTAKPH